VVEPSLVVRGGVPTLARAESTARGRRLDAAAFARLFAAE
jgi:hypothetical protein